MKKEIFEILNTEILNAGSAFPSIYSREDVIALLTSLKTKVDGLQESTGGIDVDSFARIVIEKVVDELTNADSSSLIDDLDLSLSGREIEVDSFTFDNRELSYVVGSAVNEAVEEYNEQQELEVEED